MILFTYVFSFVFARVQSNRDFFSVISMMVSGHILDDITSAELSA